MCPFYGIISNKCQSPIVQGQPSVSSYFWKPILILYITKSYKSEQILSRTCLPGFLPVKRKYFLSIFIIKLLQTFSWWRHKTIFIVLNMYFFIFLSISTQYNPCSKHFTSNFVIALPTKNERISYNLHIK